MAGHHPELAAKAEEVAERVAGLQGVVMRVVTDVVREEALDPSELEFVVVAAGEAEREVRELLQEIEGTIQVTAPRSQRAALERLRDAVAALLDATVKLKQLAASKVNTVR